MESVWRDKIQPATNPYPFESGAVLFPYYFLLASVYKQLNRKDKNIEKYMTK